MRRFVQVVLYVQMALLAFAGIVGFLTHRFPIAAKEQALARQVGFLLLAYVVILWVVARFWQKETRLLLIPIILETSGLLHHGFDALITSANLLPAPSASDIYVPLVASVIFLILYLVGYASLRRESRSIS